MSTLQYHRLALLQLLKYHQNLQEVVALQDEIAQLQALVSQHQKKHRRCDRDIAKHEQCPLCEKKYGSEVALKLHLKLKHSGKQEASDAVSGGSQRELEADPGPDKQNIRTN